MSDKIQVAAEISVQDKATAKIKEVGSQFQGMAAQARAAGSRIQQALGTTQWKNVANNFGKLGGAFRGLGSAVGRVAKPLALLLGIGTGVGMYEAIQNFQQWVETAAGLPTAARNLGTTTEQLQIAQKAFERAGVPADQFQTAILRGNDAIRRAAAGQYPKLAQYLDSLGISWREPNSQFRNAINLLPILNRNMAKQIDPATKTAIATTLFGRGMAGLNNLLGRSPAEFQKFINAAKEAGIITQEQIDTATKYRDSQRSLQDSLHAIAVQVYPVLADVLQDMAKGMADYFKDPEKRKAFVDGLSGALKGLGEVIKNINWTALTKTLESVAKWLGTGDNSAKTFKTGLLAIAGITLAPIMTQLLMVAYYGLMTVGAILKLGAVFGIALGPALIVALGIAAAAWIIWQNWNGIMEDFKVWKEQGLVALLKKWKEDLKTDIVKSFTDDWENLKKVISLLEPVWGPVAKTFRAAWKELKDDWNNNIKPVWDAWIKNPISSAVTTAWDAVQKAWTAAWGAIKKVWDNTLGPIWNLIGKGVSGLSVPQVTGGPTAQDVVAQAYPPVTPATLPTPAGGTVAAAAQQAQAPQGTVETQIKIDTTVQPPTATATSTATGRGIFATPPALGFSMAYSGANE